MSLEGYQCLVCFRLVRAASRLVVPKYVMGPQDLPPGTEVSAISVMHICKDEIENKWTPCVKIEVIDEE